jgi:hypothetical protein
MNRFALLVRLVVCACVVGWATSGSAFQLEWARQFGTASHDRSWSISGNNVAFDGLGSSYFAGMTNGTLSIPGAGPWDGLMGRYDSTGNLQWATFLGSTQYEEVHGLAADNLGNVFVGGWTTGVMGNSNAGNSDFFLQRYDVNGNLSWTQQVGTAGDDRINGVIADGLGNVYVAGLTNGSLAAPFVGSLDAFLFKFDGAGNQLWSKQLGVSPTIIAQAVATDGSGNAYISGLTWGNFAAPAQGSGDVFATKYDAAGNLQWSAQLGTSVHEDSRALAVDAAGNVYVTGYTYGNLAGPNAGGTDAFLLKYDPTGLLQWSKQIGSGGFEYGDGVSVDGAGNIYVSGSTTGSVFGPNLGATDLFLAKFDPAGVLLDSTQLGTAFDEFNSSIAVEPNGTFYVSGSTSGSFGGPSYGDVDIFQLKFSRVPEPSSALLLMTALVGWTLTCGGGVGRRRRR